MPRTHLTGMYLGWDFEFPYAHTFSSAGERIDPMDHHDKGFVGTTGLWDALPALRTLTVEGVLLFHWIGGTALADLRLRGAVISDGDVWPDRSRAS
ncbi:hypothetical protein Ait01nite_025800 [Actinoplanes italicus]|uniref:Uncharacterized protein n=1 Tax=Actinoplanes italicus TaxID=113567 RepID=A0A2T0KFB0_9ACTN|nr:hypothetical protein [Actinoplanes italicus]PRX22047.1 hypothetical protein CLV67_105224 [Actinoplanes italicus]GIE29535.1 hypothetical protein Ait01nite_025800 [Actinoplanes italicus]